MDEPDYNPVELLSCRAKQHHVEWVKQNTAILVIHGIGNQLPVETMDSFGRGLLKKYRSELGDDVTVKHEIINKPDSAGSRWFDNMIRFCKKDNPHHIDLYEYYWANYTEDKSSWSDIDSWTQGVVKGARKFYKRNAQIGRYYKDKSDFFDEKTGEFKSWRYWLFLSVMSKLTLTVDLLVRFFLWAASFIPFLGSVVDSWLKGYTDSLMRGITNVLGDVVVYNVNDPKSKFYETKKRIQEGAVKALLHLFQEPVKGRNGEYYESILVAGHSLGSQVAYDAINRLNLHVNQGLLAKRFDEAGKNMAGGKHINQVLRGFVTFGCPLDKIIFFLRENIPDDQFLRQQVLDHFNGFKQKDVNMPAGAQSKGYVKLERGQDRLFDDIPWVNYYDDHDYVSGNLDYYAKLLNVDCKFKAGKFSFTHSRYWECDPFYGDIITHFLKP